MKYCPKCGTENPDEGKFCRNCGNAFPLQSEESASEIYSVAKDSPGNSENPSPIYNAPVRENGKSSPGKILLLIASLLIILSGAGFSLWKFVIKKNSSKPKSELERVEPGNISGSNVDTALSKFIGDYYSSDANIKRTRITVRGDQLLIETFFRDGIDSCYASPIGNSVHCSGNGFDVIVMDENCIEGYFSIKFCKR